MWPKMQVCLQGGLRKTPALVAGQLFSLLLWDPRKRSRSSLAVRSFIAQIDGSKEQEKLKEKCFLAVSLREVGSALKVGYMLKVNQMKHEKQKDGTGERSKLQAPATVLYSSWSLQSGE